MFHIDVLKLDLLNLYLTCDWNTYKKQKKLQKWLIETKRIV